MGRNQMSQKRILVKVEGERLYKSADGTCMRRENGTIDGVPMDNRWVLRGPSGVFIDVDAYRNDLADRNELHLV